jgi:hypothetical protein
MKVRDFEANGRRFHDGYDYSIEYACRLQE